MFVVIMLTLAVGVATHCPRRCDCKWRDGKDAAVCPQASFTEIPSGLPSSTQLLDVSKNFFSTLPNYVFNDNGLLNLQRLYLSACKIEIIEQSAFSGLINLVELDLSNNLLKEVPSPCFTSIIDLRYLKLRGNPISVIGNEAFKDLRDLVRLILSSCEIIEIAPRAFLGIESSLQYLELSENKLKVINVNVLTPLRALKDVALSKNPWNCTCLMRPMRDWMIKRNVPITITPECSFPRRLRQQPWNRIELDEFACAPQVSAITKHPTGLEGSDAVLECKISGSPTPAIRWYRADRLIANTSDNKPYKYYIRNEGQTSKLIIKSAELHDAGAYTCFAENRGGKTECIINLSMEKARENELKKQWFIAGMTMIAVILVCSCSLGLCVVICRRRRGLDRPNEGVVTYQNDAVRLHGVKMDIEVGTPPSDVGRKRGDYRNVPSYDPEESFTHRNVHENVSLVTPLYSNKNRSEIESINFRNDMPDEDLHIPRKGTHIQSTNASSRRLIKDKLKAPIKMSFDNDFEPDTGPQTRNFSYSHISINESEKNYPDLIEMRSFEGPSTTNELQEPHYCTMKRKKGGDSCSPLINSRRNSSGGDSTGFYERPYRNWQTSWNRRSNSSSDLTREIVKSNRIRHNPSLPASPTRARRTPSATPLIDVFSPQSGTKYSTNRAEFEFHVVELEHFLDEYRTIGDQLYRSSKKIKDDLQRSRPIVNDDPIVPRARVRATGMPSTALPDAASPLTLNASELNYLRTLERRSISRK